MRRIQYKIKTTRTCPRTLLQFAVYELWKILETAPVRMQQLANYVRNRVHECTLQTHTRPSGRNRLIARLLAFLLQSICCNMLDGSTGWPNSATCAICYAQQWLWLHQDY